MTTTLSLHEAVDRLRRGEVVALPTETFYGLAVDPYNREALAKLSALKSRTVGKDYPLLVSSRQQLQELVFMEEALVQRLIDRFWPGPLTLVLPLRDRSLPFAATDGTVAVRISSHPLAQQFVQLVGRPITCTSANQSGNPPCQSAVEVRQVFAGSVYILDGGTTWGTEPSTVVRCANGLQILRQGAVSREQLERLC